MEMASASGRGLPVLGMVPAFTAAAISQRRIQIVRHAAHGARAQGFHTRLFGGVKDLPRPGSGRQGGLMRARVMKLQAQRQRIGSGRSSPKTR
jgi:hypothetical protein